MSCDGDGGSKSKSENDIEWESERGARALLSMQHISYAKYFISITFDGGSIARRFLCVVRPQCHYPVVLSIAAIDCLLLLFGLFFPLNIQSKKWIGWRETGEPQSEANSRRICSKRIRQAVTSKNCIEIIFQQSNPSFFEAQKNENNEMINQSKNNKLKRSLKNITNLY